MWLRSFQRALGILEHDRWGELSEQLNYSQHFDTALSRVSIDVPTSQIVGLLTLSGDALDYLFVYVDYQRALISKKTARRRESAQPSRADLVHV